LLVARAAAGAETVRIDVNHRRYGRVAAVGAGVLACCLLLSFWIAVHAERAAASRVSSVLLIRRQAPPAGTGRPGTRSDMVVIAAPLADCEARLGHVSPQVPTVEIAGASYTAGVGPDNPELSWAVDLARLLRWNAVIDGVPGAGYIRAGPSGRGPVARMLRDQGLAALHPALVIVQAGHDDAGVPAARERGRVRATVRLISAAAHGARIALLTVFTGPSPTVSPALRATDSAIVAAAKETDPRVIIMDPLTGQWKFQHAHGGLHPSAAGDAWIAREVAAILLAHSVRPAPADAPAPVVCDVTVGVPTGSAT
jgi:lysophospholipase L1-like esterase